MQDPLGQPLSDPNELIERHCLKDDASADLITRLKAQQRALQDRLQQGRDEEREHLQRALNAIEEAIKNVQRRFPEK